MKNYTLYIIGIIALLLAGCSGNGEQMRQQLAELEQQNRAGEKMLNDSLAEQLVDYFDRHGSANERMRARYMLGRTYFDLGELPRALETYYTARDCADTTAADCDYKVLSRIHAQSARIFNLQVLPRSQLQDLRQAVYYAQKANDTIQMIECYAPQSDAYRFLQKLDSVVLIKEEAARMFHNIGRDDRAAQTLGSTISSLVELGELEKASTYCKIYETCSGFFDAEGNVSSAHIIYYYIKGSYYIAVNKLDSAEYLFRKELSIANDLNNQIAGCKGLQRVYEQRKIPDSIAKYATLSYELNDSAYSLAEMENLQRLRASYNYEHNKHLAVEKTLEAGRAYFLVAMVVGLALVGMLIAAMAFMHYKHRKDSELADYQKDLEILALMQTEVDRLQSQTEDYSDVIEQQKKSIQELQGRIELYQQKKLRAANDIEMAINDSLIISRLHVLADATRPQVASASDIRELKVLVNDLIPSFYNTVNGGVNPLRPVEYEVSLLTRCHFKSADICRLLGRTDSYVANLKKVILQKAFGCQGTQKDFDQKILSIK